MFRRTAQRRQQYQYTPRPGRLCYAPWPPILQQRRCCYLHQGSLRTIESRASSKPFQRALGSLSTGSSSVCDFGRLVQVPATLGILFVPLFAVCDPTTAPRSSRATPVVLADARRQQHTHLLRSNRCGILKLVLLGTDQPCRYNFTKIPPPPPPPPIPSFAGLPRSSPAALCCAELACLATPPCIPWRLWARAACT